MHLLEANWLINDCCNFKCFYCIKPRKNTTTGFPDIQQIADSFNKSGRSWLIYITGGEPFLYPNLVELCKELTKNHIISINTNLFHNDIYRFAESIDPERVRNIHCSLHIQEREKRNAVDDFIKKYRFVESKGFYTYASYVLHPFFLNRFKKDYEYFKSQGIILRPKVFRGKSSNYELPDMFPFDKIQRLLKKRYPDDYTEKQKTAILSYMEQSQIDGNFKIDHHEDDIKGRLCDVHQDKTFINGLPSFTGKHCMAGKDFIRLTPDGEAYRCYNSKLYLGNLFKGTMQLLDKPQICEAKKCACPYIGYRHIAKEKPL